MEKNKIVKAFFENAERSVFFRGLEDNVDIAKYIDTIEDIQEKGQVYKLAKILGENNTDYAIIKIAKKQEKNEDRLELLSIKLNAFDIDKKHIAVLENAVRKFGFLSQVDAIGNNIERVYVSLKMEELGTFSWKKASGEMEEYVCLAIKNNIECKEIGLSFELKECLQGMLTNLIRELERIMELEVYKSIVGRHKKFHQQKGAYSPYISSLSLIEWEQYCRSKLFCSKNFGDIEEIDDTIVRIGETTSDGFYKKSFCVGKIEDMVWEFIESKSVRSSIAIRDASIYLIADIVLKLFFGVQELREKHFGFSNDQTILNAIEKIKEQVDLSYTLSSKDVSISFLDDIGTKSTSCFYGCTIKRKEGEPIFISNSELLLETTEALIKKIEANSLVK